MPSISLVFPINNALFWAISILGHIGYLKITSTNMCLTRMSTCSECDHLFQPYLDLANDSHWPWFSYPCQFSFNVNRDWHRWGAQCYYEQTSSFALAFGLGSQLHEKIFERSLASGRGHLDGSMFFQRIRQHRGQYQATLINYDW